ncbi:MAG: FecR domain-containing protein [Fulvivirga sp.]|nr:FecR domain-containing protein [Fulvivirga sp.]
MASRFRVASAEDKVAAWNKLSLHSSKQIFLYHYLRLAASVILVIATTFTIYSFAQIEILSARGEHKIVKLPDNSSVQLNAESALSYNRLLWFFDRNVALQGEGFFKVKKGSRFTVATAHGNVAVLGTSFNVYTRPDKFNVACVTGKVKVSNAKNSVILTPGHYTSSHNKSLSKPDSFNREITAWQSGEFYFENARLSEVVAELERQFDIDILLDAGGERYYTGFFKNNNLEEALKMVCIPMGLQYDIKSAKKIIITTNKYFN